MTTIYNYPEKFKYLRMLKFQILSARKPIQVWQWPVNCSHRYEWNLLIRLFVDFLVFSPWSLYQETCSHAFSSTFSLISSTFLRKRSFGVHLSLKARNIPRLTDTHILDVGWTQNKQGVIHSICYYGHLNLKDVAPQILGSGAPTKWWSSCLLIQCHLWIFENTPDSWRNHN